MTSKKMGTAAALAFAGLLALAAISPGAQAAKETFDRSKPHISIKAETQGVDLGGFDQIRGLGIDVGVEEIEYEDGDDIIVRKRPGRTTYSNVTLLRTYNGATDIEEWANEAATGRIPRTRRNVQIQMLDRSAAVVRTFNLIDTFPVHWRIATNADGLAIEELTLSVEFLVPVD